MEDTKLTNVSADARKGDSSIGCRSKPSAKHKAVSDAHGAISQLQKHFATAIVDSDVMQWKMATSSWMTEFAVAQVLVAYVNTIGFSFSCGPSLLSLAVRPASSLPLGSLRRPLIEAALRYFAPSRCS